MTTSNEHNNAPAVQQGWKLVPVEPTRAMWAAVNKLDDEMAAGSYDGKGCSIEQAWNCMLDFAPDAPALEATPAPAPAQDEPLGHFRVEPFGWTDCAKDDEGAIALYERPQEVGLTDEGRQQVFIAAERRMVREPNLSWRDAIVDEVIAALRAKGGQVMDDAQAPAPAQEIDKSVADAEIKAMYVESQGSDKGWLGIEGSYFIGGVVAARRQKKATAPAQEPSRPQNCGTSYCSCIECVCEPAQGVGLTDETQAQDERRSTHLAASGGAHVG